jgi:N-acetylglucosaminyldiphosphoundecaprenol N-acetyl-beta-D-mannosaminyltransferase
MTGRQYLADIPIDLFEDRAMIMERIRGWLRQPECPRQIVTLNASMLVKSLNCPALKRAIRGADLVTIDGCGIERALRKMGLSGICRIAGIELVRELLTCVEIIGISVFFYGGSPDMVEKLRRQLKALWPGITIAGIVNGYDIRCDARRIGDKIIQCRPGLLVVGLGSPRQEIFLAKLLPHLAGTVGIGVGGALEVIAGVKKEAPQFVRDYGWEWLYRMGQEPRKFGGLMDLARFWNRFLR